MKKVKITLSILSVLVLLIGVYYFFGPAERAVAGLADAARDMAGTRVATTTTGAGYYKLPANNGTTTKSIQIGGDYDLATFTFKVTAASSSPDGTFTWAVLGSNDASCNTASTSSETLNTVLVKDINWFDISSGKITATGAVATGTVTTLTNLNWSCLALETNGSSTTVWSQMRVKDSR